MALIITLALVECFSDLCDLLRQDVIRVSDQLYVFTSITESWPRTADQHAVCIHLHHWVMTRDSWSTCCMYSPPSLSHDQGQLINMLYVFTSITESWPRTADQHAVCIHLHHWVMTRDSWSTCCMYSPPSLSRDQGQLINMLYVFTSITESWPGTGDQHAVCIHLHHWVVTKDSWSTCCMYSPPSLSRDQGQLINMLYVFTSITQSWPRAADQHAVCIHLHHWVVTRDSWSTCCMYSPPSLSRDQGQLINMLYVFTSITESWPRTADQHAVCIHLHHGVVTKDSWSTCCMYSPPSLSRDQGQLINMLYVFTSITESWPGTADQHAVCIHLHHWVMTRDSWSTCCMYSPPSLSRDQGQLINMLYVFTSITESWPGTADQHAVCIHLHHSVVTRDSWSTCCMYSPPSLSRDQGQLINMLYVFTSITESWPQARATPSWWTHNKCCPHSLLPGIEYSRHVTPWAISRAPHYRLKSIKVFSLITSRTLPKKGMHSGIYMTFLKIIRTSMTRYICALAVVFFKLRWHKQPQVRLQNFQYYCLRCNRLVCRMTPWVSVRFVRVPQCSTAGRHVISGKRRNYDMYCHVV